MTPRSRHHAGGRLVVGVLAGSGILGLALAVTPAAWATSPPPAVGSFAIAPVSPANVSARRSDFRYQAKPGQMIVDSVQVFNFFSTPQTFELYATNAYDTAAGSFALRPRGSEDFGIGAWTKLSQSQIAVPPSTAQTITFQMSIPRNATPGDYAGGIVALDTTETSGSPSHSRVALREGVATAVFLRLAGRLSPGATIGALRTKLSVPALAPLLGTSDAHIRVVVANTGNTILSGKVWVQVTDVFGHVVKQFRPVVLPGVLPEAKITVTEPAWRELPAAGPEHVHVTFTAQGLHAVRTSTTFWVLPWGLVAGLGAVALLILVVLVLLLRRLFESTPRRRRPRHVTKSGKGGKGKAAEPEQLALFEGRERTARKLEASSRR
jgi:hypothetical protein